AHAHHDDSHVAVKQSDALHENEQANEHADEIHDEEAHEDHHGLAPGQKPHESPSVVWVPLVLLAIPSVIIGLLTIEPMLFGSWFKGAIFVAQSHDVLGEIGKEFHGVGAMGVHGLFSLPFLLAMTGVVLAWFLYLQRPDMPTSLQRRFGFIYRLLDNKYYFDRFNEIVFAGGARLLGRILWKVGDEALIDGMAVNGSAGLVGWIARMSRFIQTGHIYQYAFWIIIGVVLMLWAFKPWGLGL
ncbi:MAG TPA: hypothetical protein VFW00_11395, partial [Rhodocyclaceae bacterium]|nr:hypothetical protein [Rhodocyclaceae bacterium]